MYQIQSNCNSTKRQSISEQLVNVPIDDLEREILIIIKNHVPT